MQLDCTLEEALEWNALGYNLYEYANSVSPARLTSLPKNPNTGATRFLKAKDIDLFHWVFMDLDMKDFQSTDPNRRHEYATKDDVIARVMSEKILPNKLIDSGGGIHAYWRVSDLDAKSYLRLQRRVARYLHSDPAVAMIKQLMRVPGSVNMKKPEDPRACEMLYEDTETVYDSETLDKWLPPITNEDEEFINRHHDMAYELNQDKIKLTEELPRKFLDLCRENPEIKHLFYGQHKDRSTADWRLGKLLFHNGLTREEAMSVLSRTSKATERTRAHQYGYGEGIVTKIWDEEEQAAEEAKSTLKFPIRSMSDIEECEETEGERIVCDPVIDATADGFRRGQVFGLIGGSGNGKSSFALNMIRWFSERNVNKNYIYLYVSLEMPEKQVQRKWKKMVKHLKKERPEVVWDDLVYVLGNFNKDGSRRNLGIDDIKSYVKVLEAQKGRKVGAITIDHVGIIKQTKSSKTNETAGLIGVIEELKPLALATDTFVIIQSQTSRAKNLNGDAELDMDAGFGTSNFEWYSDWIATIWQPLKRVYNRMDKDAKLCVSCFKMCKVREKDVIEDRLQADTVYGLAYDVADEVFREMTTDEEKRYDFWNKQATSLRNKDRKKEPSSMVSIGWTATKREKSPEVSK